MGTAVSGHLGDIVRAARERTGVPGVAAGLAVDGEVEIVADGVLGLGGDEPVRPETPFRVASISKWFTASLAALCLDLDAPVLGEASASALLSHTAGLRCESAEPLPEIARGLWSYSNAGYWAAGEACAAACGAPFAEAMRARVLAPLGLGATGYEEPAAPARGHVQEAGTGQREAPEDAYPVARRPSGGIWSTVADLMRFGAHQLGGPGPLHEAARAGLRMPRAEALGAAYAHGFWVRELAGGRVALDHEGSVGGYQSLLLLVPEERLVLAVLTNSWRGRGLIRRVVRDLGLVPVGAGPSSAAPERVWAGRYVLDGSEAEVDVVGDVVRVREAEVDPVTGTRIASPAWRAEPVGGGTYGVAGGLLMSHRVDFPRAGVARVGWVALPRLER
ncbi:MAG TPA: serine hydrolase domain-containing protein [Gaiellaceae bacterium]|nr:serine hydrolase domain-containing protein [Gaiellaceae bacterium]